MTIGTNTNSASVYSISAQPPTTEPKVEQKKSQQQEVTQTQVQNNTPQPVAKTATQKKQDADNAQQILNTQTTPEAAKASYARTAPTTGTTDATPLPKPSEETLSGVADSLKRLKEIGEDASKSYTNEYKSYLQKEVNELKDGISKSLEGTNMSLKSLGIEDFDVTEDFSMDSIDKALEKVGVDTGSSSGTTSNADPSDEVLSSVEESLSRMQELSKNASRASTDAYKSLIQKEVNELKESIGKDLEGTNMSLESLGIEDFDVTGKFSSKTVDDALEQVDKKLNGSEEESGSSAVKAPSKETLNSVEENLKRLEEWGQMANDSFTAGYKSFIQTEVDKVKEDISKSLEGTNMSLESLGIEDFDVTGKFSLDDIYEAIETVSGEEYTPTVDPETPEFQPENPDYQKPQFELNQFKVETEEYKGLLEDFSANQTLQYSMWEGYGNLLSMFNGTSSSSIYNLL